MSSLGMDRPRRHVVVTAGPTHEYIDPVRFLGNVSSGRMGFEIARAAARRGHRVTLIAGPVDLASPRGVRRVDVTSAREMLAATRAAFDGADALYMAAAVGDFRPARRRSGKWRAKDHGSERASLELIRNPDILAILGRVKGPRLVVGFALETGRGLVRARRKLEAKGADFIVLNDASALGSERTSVTILGPGGVLQHLENRTKRSVSSALLGLLDAWPPRETPD